MGGPNRDGFSPKIPYLFCLIRTNFTFRSPTQLTYTTQLIYFRFAYRMVFVGFVDAPPRLESQSASVQLRFRTVFLWSFSMSRKKLTSKNGAFLRKFFLESLEPRAMLAGNVNVFVSGGTLFVQGDADDNAVLIQQEDNGVYSVTGIDFGDLNVPAEVFESGANRHDAVS